MHIAPLSWAKARTISSLRGASKRLEALADAVDHWQIMSPEERQILAINCEFMNKHAGQRGFVIGNGPSLARQNLSLLANDVTFAVSGFWKHPVITEWQPTYYAILDHTFFDGSESCDLFFESLRQHITRSTVFLPLHERPVVVKRNLLPASQVRYVRTAGKVANMHLPSVDLTRPIGSGTSVSILALMLALAMGCNPIYLIGMDHDWLAHRGQDLHFYYGTTLENHPKANGNLGLIPYKVEIHNNLMLWNDYENLKRLSVQKGIRILNATDGGFLDVFERVSYLSLFLG